MYEQGSTWRKWDLHIHSPLSILNNQYQKMKDGNPDWEAFISKLESLGDVGVIAITDYFTIDGYKVVMEYKRKGRLSNVHTILPNIEFRLNSVLSSKKDGKEPRRLNYHVIFSDMVDVKDIEEHFLHDIHFFFEGNPQDKDDTRKLKSSNIEELGKKLIEQHKKFKDSGSGPLVIGAMQTVVSHEEISECLKDSRFKGKYIIVFPEEHSNLIDWDGQDHHIRKGLLQKADMVFSSNANTRLWCLGREPYADGMEKYIDEFKTLKPCIHGSDAHKIDEVMWPCSLRGTKGHNCAEDNQECELRYCWIKADPTFEGLKQLLYEPSDRVVIWQNDPTPLKSNYTQSRFIMNASVINDELSINSTDIQLNSGLVAVTGGKGSGKTALVDLMANCYKDRCNTEDTNSFVRRIADQMPNLKTSIIFRDGSVFEKNVCEDLFFEDSDVVYIAQGELENYISDDSDLDIYIKNLIFESPQIKDTVLNHEYNELLDDINIAQELIALQNDKIHNLEKLTSTDISQAITIDSKQKEAELKDTVTRLSELEKAQSDNKIKIAHDKQKIISEYKARKDDLSILKNMISQAISFIDTDIRVFNDAIKSINGILIKLEIAEEYKYITYDQKNDLEKRLSTVRTEISDIVKRIEDSQKELETYEISVRDHAKLIDKKKDIERAIKNINAKRDDLKKKEKGLKEAIQERKDLLFKLIHTVILTKNKYNDIIKAFSEKKAEVLSDLNFDARIYYNKNKYVETAEQLLDNRKVKIGGKGEESIFADLFTITDSILKDSENSIRNYVDEIERLNIEYKSKIKGTQDITIRNYYELLYGNYFEIIPTVKYKNTPISKLSLGQKATVLIKIYLAQGDKPIIIDSHDDHLDNEFIMDELVKAIRQAKQYRQIILASNNGNVVINSDAEQIIIANRKDGRISYTSGSIENPLIYERAVHVLEGGPEAFKRRQQKYRLIIS